MSNQLSALELKFDKMKAKFSTRFETERRELLNTIENMENSFWNNNRFKNFKEENDGRVNLEVQKRFDLFA